MRVMIRMLTTTYGESVNSTPIRAIGDPSGPIEKGATYIVRPLMQPSKSQLSVSFISLGATQLLVGPASVWLTLQMKVRSSTRATSPGSERARKLLGRFSGLSRIKVPLSTIASTQLRSRTFWMSSGAITAAVPFTKEVAPNEGNDEASSQVSISFLRRG